MDLTHWTTSRRVWIDEIFDKLLPVRSAGNDPGRLVESMRYSLLAPGKRLRPLLALAAAEAVGLDTARVTDQGHPNAHEPLVIAAAAVELVHCYSLIHDDLPAMDDDDWRRGNPSNHKVFGEATAILAGDALLTLAFEWLAEAGDRTGRPQDFCRAMLALARGAGVNGMVRGQARDLGEAPPEGFADLEELHDEKTAALFRAAAEVGAAAAGGSATQIAAVGSFGQKFGVAFQHADDREDGDHARHADRVRDRVPALLAEAVGALDALANPDRGATLRALSDQLLIKVVGAPTEY
ncbi:MAG: polyprenyl synthetase family protein [Deltaproteobacteria bacterium]|nr:polyprenyl synthetase family protein [Deltaproteobacteria bacterium]